MMQLTVREFTKIQAAAELIWSIAEAAGKSGRVFEVAASQVLDELHVIRMREAERMDEWAPGELTEDLDDGERWALALARKINADRLPDVPDWRDAKPAKTVGKREPSDKSAKRGKDGAAQFASEDRLTQIRLTVSAHQGENLGQIIDAIRKENGISCRELASILGVNKARISEAMNGKPRPGFIARFAEVLGEGGAI